MDKAIKARLDDLYGLCDLLSREVHRLNVEIFELRKAVQISTDISRRLPEGDERFESLIETLMKLNNELASPERSPAP